MDENLRESKGEHEHLNVLNSNKENKQKNESETEDGRIMKDDRHKVSVINKFWWVIRNNIKLIEVEPYIGYLQHSIFYVFSERQSDTLNMVIGNLKKKG